MGALAHLCGIRPWEHDLLTTGEFRDCCDWIDAYQEGARSRRDQS